tara:strand:- start:8597 stop:9523 length:927 start_codon:yes stop_codon:yes gene_type:complete
MKCILCNSKNFDIIATKLRNNIERNVVRCKDCKLTSLENPESDIINYKNDYRKLYSPIIGTQLSPKEFFDYELEFQKPRKNRIKHLLHSEYDILEIGSSTGHFLHSIKNDVNTVTGIELDENYANFAINSCDLSIFKEPLEKINFNGKKFDVIFLFQVFEHIHNPISLLSEIKKHLKNNGIIHLEVPNLNDALISLYNINEFSEFYFRLPHVYYYDKSTLMKLMNIQGFEGKVSFHQEFSIFNHIHWLQNKSPQKDQKNASELPHWSSNNEQMSTVFKKWFSKIDQEYKQLLKDNEISEVLSFTGKIK